MVNIFWYGIAVGVVGILLLAMIVVIIVLIRKTSSLRENVQSLQAQIDEAKQETNRRFTDEVSVLQRDIEDAEQRTNQRINNEVSTLQRNIDDGYRNAVSNSNSYTDSRVDKVLEGLKK